MTYNIKQLFLMALLANLLYSCGGMNDNADKATQDSISVESKSANEFNIDKTALAAALTFHASFDNGPNADYGSGDLMIYSGDFNKYSEEGTPVVVPGLGEQPLELVADGGRYGAALELTAENTHVVGYMLENNMEAPGAGFGGTVSLWMRLNAEDIPGTYCDPIQLTDTDYATHAIWVDITKNDVPPDFRLGFFGDQTVWDPENLKGKSQEFFWRLVKMSEPPFARDQWTHVVITWEKVNTEEIGRAKLYVNGEYTGPSGPIREPFKWDMKKASLRLGTGKYVGLFDDMALFNKALSAEEVKGLYGLEGGVTELVNSEQ